MNGINLTEQQQKTALQRLSSALSSVPKISAQALIYGATLGAILSLSPEASDQLLIASPLLASFIGSVSGDVITGLLEKVASKDEPTPEEILQLLEESITQTQGMTELLGKMLTTRQFVEVIQVLHDKQATRFTNLDRQGDLTLALLGIILQKIEALEVETKLEPVDESESVVCYLQWVQNQYDSLQILGMSRPMALDAIYADVYLLDKQKYEASKENQQEQFLAREPRQTDERREGVALLETEKLLFVVGKPGAGKTTFMRRLALQAARKELPIAKTPVYIELKRLNTSTETLFDLIVGEFSHANFANAQTYAERLLNTGEALILLDGLDEVIPEKREAVNDQIIALRKRCGDSHLLLTCRPHAEKRNFEKFSYVEVADFLPDQVKRFVRNWFGEAADTADSLLKELDETEHKTIRELTGTPLLLALLCIAYADKPQFPKKRHELYERALEVVLVQWDNTRGIKRESVYGQLTLARKKQLLAYVAFHTFEEKDYFIPQDTLEEHINIVAEMFRLKDIECQKEESGGFIFEPDKLFPSDINPKDIIAEIAAQHGLFVTQIDDSFSFSHLTFQEYFATKYIVSNMWRKTLELLLNHSDDTQWREVFLLTASLLEEEDAGYFFSLFIARLNEMIADVEPIQGMLRWATEKQVAYSQWEAVTRKERGSGSECIKWAAYGRAALRAYYYLVALDLTLAIASDRAIASDFTSDLDLALATTLALASDFALDLASDLDLDLALDLALDRGLASASIHARNLRLDKFAEQLEALSIPDEDTPQEKWDTYADNLRQVINNFRDLSGISDLSQSVTKEDEVRLNDIVWDEASIEAYTAYLSGTALLLNCLELAMVGNRKEIEARLLLPAGG